MPPKPFKPPRPSAGTTGSTTKNTPGGSKITKSKAKPRTSTSSITPARSSNILPSLSPDSSQSSNPGTPSPEPSANEAQLPPRQDPKETLPPKLLSRLLHEFFKHENTRVSQDAGVAIGRYMDTFVREAVARAAYTRENEEGEDGAGFLEVEDLEKLAPQLLLDF